MNIEKFEKVLSLDHAKLQRKLFFMSAYYTCWCYLKQNCIKIQKTLQCNADKIM